MTSLHGVRVIVASKDKLGAANAANYLNGVRVIVASKDKLGAANAANLLDTARIIPASANTCADVCVAGPAP